MYILGFLTVFIIIFSVYRSFKYEQRKNFIENFDYSTILKNKVINQYDKENVVKGLKQFFLICLENKMQIMSLSSKTVGLPSKLISSVLKDFMTSSKEYELFCKKAFGKFLHYTDSENMNSEPIECEISESTFALVNTWNTACQIEEVDHTKPKKIPLIFKIDREADIKNGLHYTLNYDYHQKDFCVNKISLSMEDHVSRKYCSGFCSF